MQHDSFIVASVHGKVVVPCNVIRGQDVGYSLWILPHFFGVIAEPTFLSQDNGPCVAMHLNCSSVRMYAPEKLAAGHDVDG